MTPSPLSPEAVAQLVADREAGTPGPWQFQIETDQDGYDEVVYVTADIVTIHWSNLGFGADEYDTRVDDAIKANASRIARLPALEAAYLTLAAENATLIEQRDFCRQVYFQTAEKLVAERGELVVLRAERDAWTKIDVARDADFATLRASEAAALERVAELEAAACSYQASLLKQGIDGSKGPKE